VSILDTPKLPDDGSLTPDRATQLELQALSGLIHRLEQVVVPDMLPRLRAVQDAIAGFGIKVSLVGQVKAGKTALTNALINQPDLLPSDVNPWTSVITSVHVNTAKPQDHRAVFSFFNRAEWDDMVNIGGRLGAAAQRAGFADEFDAIQDQIRQMQANAEHRLGRNFKYLLGSAHRFSGFTPDLIKRYVCLGDDTDATAPEGRFADLTRSADIYIDDDSYALPMTIRDTPGVNDPFLMRETVTLANLGDTDICVIVLSAHQAFTTVDIALLRILLALRQDQIVLFVNRIDELEDPDQQIAAIDSYIRDALGEQGLPSDLPIIFGSALWARSHMEGLTEPMIARSHRSMDQLMAARLRKASAHDGPLPLPGSAQSTALKTHDLAGLAELQAVIAQKAGDGIGQSFITAQKRHLQAICDQSRAILQNALGGQADLQGAPDAGALAAQMEKLLSGMDQQLQQARSDCAEALVFALSDTYRSFIEAETRQIDQAFATGGTGSGWQPATDRLRRDLNAAYRDNDILVQERIGAIYQASARAISQIYDHLLGPDLRLFAVTPPAVTVAPTPTILMQSMTIDITTSWLDKWLSRDAGKAAFTQRFEKIIADDMHKTIAAMQDSYLADRFGRARHDLHDFISDQLTCLQGMVRSDAGLGLESEITRKLHQIAAIAAQIKGDV
jgi:hypothetical protein